MAGRSDIKAGGAYVELFTKDSQLIKGLNAAKKRLQDFGKSVMAVGGFFSGLGAGLLTPLAGAVAQFVSFGGALDDMSARTGLTRESLAELKFAAEQSGAGLGDVELALQNMARKGIHETLDQAAARIAAIADPSERAKEAIETFGRSGTALLPMLENLQALRAEARAGGLVPTEESMKAADQLGDAFAKVKAVVAGTFFEIGAAMAPVLLPLARTVSTVVGRINLWIRENGQLVRTVAMVGAGLLAAGAVITGVGAAIFGLGAAAGVAATVLSAIGTAIGLVLSPVGLLTIGLVGAAVAFFRFTETGRQAVAFVGEKLGELAATARETFGGIADALAAGDLGLAAKVAWAGIRVAWQQGTQEINRLWLDAKFFFLLTWEEAKTGLAKLFISAFAAVQRAWVNTVAFLEATWTRFFTLMMNGWQRAQQGIGNLIIAAAEKSGLVSTEFAQAWRESLNEPINQDIASRTNRAGQQQEEIERRRQGALNQINADETGARGILEDDKRRAQQRLAGQHDADIAGKQRALDDARREFLAAREAARAAGEQARSGSGQSGITPPEDLATKAAAATVTFSGAALLAAGQGGGVADMAKDIRTQVLIQRNQEKHLKRLAEKEGLVTS